MSIQPIFGRVAELKAALENLSVPELKAEMANRPDLLVVDIREIQETIDLGTIPGSVHVARGMLEFWADPASPYFRDYFSSDKRIVVFCAGGGRSAFAAKALLDMGYPDVAHLEVGFNGWAKAGEPVEEVASTSRWMRKPKGGEDGRPPMWIGHTVMRVPDIEATFEFFLKLGLRPVSNTKGVDIVELRGGTHLILLPAEAPVVPGASASFDLMCDDLEATHGALMAAGLAPSPIESGEIHRSFTITEPGGHCITVNSTHVTGHPV
jgi:rhodanese-related sulfurtransferase